MAKFFYVLYTVLVLVISCGRIDKNIEDTSMDRYGFERFVNRGNLLDKKFDEIIVIPGVGCSGCISDAQRDFNKNYKHIRKLYIFTAIEDLKLFKNSIPTDALAYGNVILDTANVMQKLGFTSIYPSKLTAKENVMIIKPLN